MERAYLVQVFYGKKGQLGNIATGYPVAKDRILTARHALVSTDQPIDIDQIKIRWYGQEGQVREWRAIENIAWDGSKLGLDAVLLDSTFPELIRHWGLLSERVPETGALWESAGFAEAGKMEDVSPPVSMQGEAFRPALNDMTLSLGAKYPPETEEGWRGASGSPVFLQGAIVGVIESCPAHFSAARLNAVWMRRLLADDKFRREVGQDDEVERRTAFQVKVVRLLHRSERAMEVLGRRCRDRGRESGTKGDERAKKLAVWLLDPTQVETLSDLEDACSELADNGDHGAAAIIQETACIVVVALFDPSVIESIRARKTVGASGLLSIPAAVRTVADMIMAGVDRRPVDCPRPTWDEPWPAGKLALPSPPESGIQANTAETYVDGYHEHIIGKFVDPSTRKRFSRQDQIDSASRRLASLSRKGGTRYFLFEMMYEESDQGASSCEDHRKLIDEIAALLTEAYPATMALLLSNDGVLLAQQEEEYETFQRILEIETDTS